MMAEYGTPGETHCNIQGYSNYLELKSPHSKAMVTPSWCHVSDLYLQQRCTVGFQSMPISMVSVGSSNGGQLLEFLPTDVHR